MLPEYIKMEVVGGGGCWWSPLLPGDMADDVDDDDVLTMWFTSVEGSVVVGAFLKGLSIIWASGEQKVVNLALGLRLIVLFSFSENLLSDLICNLQLEPPVCCNLFSLEFEGGRFRLVSVDADPAEICKLLSEGFRGNVVAAPRPWWWWWWEIA